MTTHTGEELRKPNESNSGYPISWSHLLFAVTKPLLFLPAPPATDGIRGFKNKSGRHTGCPLKYDQHAKSKQTNRSAFMNALHCHFGRLALRSSAGETWRIYGRHGLVDRQPADLTGIHMQSGQGSTGNLTRIYRKSDQDLPEI